MDVYIECLKRHPHKRIEQELCQVRSAFNLPLFEANYGISEDRLSSASSFFQNDLLLYLEANLSLDNDSSHEKRNKLSNNLFDYRNKENKKLFDKKADLNEEFLLKAPARPKNWEQSGVFLSHGTLFNDLLLYKEAIQVLTHAIQLNPSNRDAYIERALAYFETNQLSLALQDYEAAKKLTIVPPFKPGSHKAMMMAAIYIPENKTEFSKGLVLGTVDGAKVSAVEFIPSIFSCCRGILNGLWAFVCSPIEVSQEMVNTAYAIGEFISSHSTEECFQCVVPELKELSLSWDKLNDHSRGQKIGFIIGKYGVDIFAPVGALKGMNKVRALKRANTMCTLESCAASQAKQAKILEESY